MDLTPPKLGARLDPRPARSEPPRTWAPLRLAVGALALAWGCGARALPSETVSTETVSTETVSSDTTPSEATPSEATPSEGNRAVASPASVVGSDTAPAQATPAVASVSAPTVFCEVEGGACRFAGRVTELRAGAIRLPRSDLAVPASVAGTHVVLTSEECAPPVALVGVRGSSESGPMRGAEGPLVTEIFVAAPDGYPPLSLAAGQCVVGTVARLGLGYDSGREVVLFRDGVLLFAEAPSMPRTPSPLADWSFRRGELRRTARTMEDYWIDTYDMQVSHDGVVEELAADDGVSIEQGSGRYLVEARGYRTRGSLPPWVAWMQREGYGFRIVRDERSPAAPSADEHTSPR